MRGPEGASVQQCTGATRLVLGVFGQDSGEMLLAEDQHVVQALAAKRSREPPGE